MLNRSESRGLTKRLMLLLTAALYFAGAAGPLDHLISGSSHSGFTTEQQVESPAPDDDGIPHNELSCAICQGLRAVAITEPGTLVPQETFVRTSPVDCSAVPQTACSTSRTQARAPPLA